MLAVSILYQTFGLYETFYEKSCLFAYRQHITHFAKDVSCIYAATIPNFLFRTYCCGFEMGTFITGCLDFTDLTGAQMPQLQL